MSLASGRATRLALVGLAILAADSRSHSVREAAIKGR